MKIAAIVLLSSVLLSGCSSGDTGCSYFDRNIAREEGIIYKTDEILEVRELTEDEYSDRINAASDLTDLYMRADEAGCPHN
jgi:hypothetical protein